MSFKDINNNSLSTENDSVKRDLEALFLQQKQSLLKQLKSLAKRAEKTVLQRQQILAQCQQWQQCHHQGIMLQSQLFRLHKGMAEVTVDDWENGGIPQRISLNPLLEPYLQTEALFKRSRKLRLGLPHAERMLQLAQNESLRRQSQLSTLEKITLAAELEAFCHQNNLSATPSTQTKPRHKKHQPAKPYHTYVLTSGLYVWVGKSAKNNDLLSFQHANGSDWWLHIRDYPGSHIVVRCNKNQTLDGEDLKDAAELALRFSKAQNIKFGEIALTQVKYLKRIKGVPGKVQLSKHKIVHHTPEEKRWQRLKTQRLH